MRFVRRLTWAMMVLVPALAGCARHAEPVPRVTRIERDPGAQKRAQTALINALPGDVIEFGPGVFEFNSTLSLDVSGVTIRGQGHERTVLSFRTQRQGTGGEGLLVTSKEKVTIEDLAVEDAKGDAVKFNGCRGVTLRRVRTGWTGGPQETNGAYGLYPVLSSDVLIEDCVARDASDAGIYVGQSENIIVRRNRVERNVAGIEIENSLRADVHDNLATDNTGGILVFSLPDLEKKNGRECRVYHNQVIANNRENFAPKGNIVGSVPVGTGIMLLASRSVEVFDNRIENNQTAGLVICSYLVTQRPFTDSAYDPYSEAIYVHDNQFVGGGDKPNGTLGLLVAGLVGGKLPSIVYDGVMDPAKTVGDALPDELAIRIRHNGDADFVNFDFQRLNLGSLLGLRKGAVSRDLKPYDGQLPSLAPVTIAGVK